MVKTTTDPGASTDMISTIINAMACIVVVLDREGRIVAFNLPAERISGYSLDELKGRHFWDALVPPEQVEQTKQEFMRLQPAGQAHTGEQAWTTRAGERRVITWSNAFYLDALTGARYMILTGIDITEQRRTEESLRLSQTRLKGIIESAMDAIVTVNEQHKVVVFNEAAEKMFQCPASEAMGADLDRFIPERFRPGHRGHVAAFGRTGTTQRTMARLGLVQGLRRDGTEFPLEATISQLDVGGQKLFTAVIRDVTERKRAEREHEEFHAKLLHQAKLAEVGLLASGLAHEIGNPLASIQAVCDNQLRKPIDPAVAEKFQRIREQTVRITKIVRQLVDFARPGPAAMQPVRVNEVVESALAIAKLSRSAKTVEVSQDLDQNLPVVSGVQDQLAQVFLNLLLNAIDAMQEGGGGLWISSRAVNGKVIVAVRDNGCGIPPENLSKLFTPFFTSKDVGKGTGLGLHVSNGIITAHGGRILVESRAGEGSTFSVELPSQSEAGS